MAQSIDLNAGGSASFQFERPGDTVTGRVTNLEELQQTDLATGEVKTFTNGQPMMMYRAELQTQLKDDPMDDGIRSVYLKGSKKPESQSSLAAVLAAVRTVTGRYSIAVGGVLTLTYVGDGVAQTRGHNAPKLYSASYVAPTIDLGGGPALAAPQQHVPAPFPPAAQQHINPATGEVTYPAAQPVQPAQQQYTAPAPVQQAAPPAAAGPTPEQVAALQAAGIDPAAVYPGWRG